MEERGTKIKLGSIINIIRKDLKLKGKYYKIKIFEIEIKNKNKNKNK
jgi:hypothetical protein